MDADIKIIGNSKVIIDLKDKIAQVAKTKATVLVTGESGTGKELVARLLHSQSQRKDNKFIPINCGAIPSELLESELFGHEKGAFTGASATRIGRFELANKGTLFLDEISEMPLFMQVKILRVIQEQVIERLGGTKSISIDARIVAATNVELENKIKEAKFREDLYYRLNVIPINIPALRDRIEDIDCLIYYFQNEIEKQEGVRCKIDSNIISILSNYSWPGNIRELFNIVERLSILYPNQVIEPTHLPQKIKINSSQDNFGDMTQTVITTNVETDFSEEFSLKDKIQQIEADYIKRALADNNGIVAQAANSLGIRRTTLVEKIKKLNIDPKTLKEA